MDTNNHFSSEIKNIFENNTLTDLKRFIKQRERLNNTNSYLIYLFHLVQSAGILTSSIAAGNNDLNILWFGIGLNLFATLINVYEKTNNSILKKLMDDIVSIKNGTYVDESLIIDTLSDNSSSPRPSSSLLPKISQNTNASELITLDNSLNSSSYKTFTPTNV